MLYKWGKSQAHISTFAMSVVSKKIIIWSISIAGKYDVNEALDLLFDDKFSFSDGMISEEGEDVYCCRRDAYFTKESIADLGKQLVSDA